MTTATTRATDNKSKVKSQASGTKVTSTETAARNGKNKKILLLSDFCEKLLKTDGWQYETQKNENGTLLYSDISVEGLTVRLLLRPIEENRLIFINVTGDFPVNHNNITAVTDFFARASFSMVTGSFEIEPDSGAWGFRSHFNCSDNVPPEDGLRVAIGAALHTFTLYYAGFSGVNAGTLGPRQACYMVEAAAGTANPDSIPVSFIGNV